MKKDRMIAMVVVMGMIFAGTTAYAQNKKTESRLENGKKNYTMAMRSGHEGLSESALMQAAKIAMKYPNTPVGEMKNVIDSLAVNGRTASIRYKAYLAANVCDNPAWFAKNIRYNEDDVDGFFVSVASQLHEIVLGSRTN